MLLNKSQIVALLQRYLPSDQAYLANTIADQLENASKNPNGSSNASLSFYDYLKQLDNTSGAPGPSFEDANGQNIQISPDAQAILNGGDYGNNNSTYNMAIEAKTVAASNNGGLSQYYQIGDTPVGQAVNELYEPTSYGYQILLNYANQLTNNPPITDGTSDTLSLIIKALSKRRAEKRSAFRHLSCRHHRDPPVAPSRVGERA